MNNKGFSLVEIIAVIAILGILSGVTIMAVNEYLQNSRKKVYESMEESIYNATENMLQNPPTAAELENAGYDFVKADLYARTIEQIVSQKLTELHPSKDIPVDLLIKLGYLDSLSDPTKKGANCNSNSQVIITAIFSGNKNAIYKLNYQVILKCSNYTSPSTTIFPRKTN